MMGRASLRVTHLCGAAALVALSAGGNPLDGQVPTGSMDGRTVMERYEKQQRTADTQAMMSMTLIDARGRTRSRLLTLSTKTRGDETRMQLVRFHEPADIAGTAFLTIEQSAGEDDAWLYVPALRRTRRIAGAGRRDRFAGTDFTFEDLEPEVLQEHEYELLGEEALGPVPTWHLRATPADPSREEDSAYGYRELWISRDRHVLIQARFYAWDGTLLRRYSANDIREVEATGRWRAHRMVMEDEERGTRTVLDVSEYRINQGIDDQLFTERFLRRGG